MNMYVKYYLSGLNILLLAVLGSVCGYLFQDKVLFLKPFGDVFISLIKMLIIPIIFFTVLKATSLLGEHNKAIKLSVFSLLYFLGSSFLAGLLGVALSLYLQPGLGVGSLPQQFLSMSQDMKAAATTKIVTIWDFIFNMIPLNPVKAMADGNLLPVLFFSIFVGVALSYVKHKDKDNVIKSIDVYAEVFLWIIAKVMYLAPVAVFCLMAYLVATIGLNVIYLVGKLFLTVIMGHIIWVYGVLATLAMFSGKVSYFQFVKTIFPLQLIAFSTSSSLVSLPKNMETCTKLGADKKIMSLILPLGATLNMNGSALYYVVVTMFFAQMFQVDITFYTYILIALTAAFGSMATPGVPGLSLTIIMVILVAHVPLIGLPLIFAVDRILDMPITSVNVVGDTTATMLASRLFGESK
ncbi:Proton/glutamate-aspartate symporter [Candidatus Hepatincola sp. Pdp]